MGASGFVLYLAWNAQYSAMSGCRDAWDPPPSRSPADGGWRRFAGMSLHAAWARADRSHGVCHVRVNTIVAAVNIFAVVTGGHGLYYVFFAAVEVLSLLLLVWLAWRRPEPRPVS